MKGYLTTILMCLALMTCIILASCSDEKLGTEENSITTSTIDAPVEDLVLWEKGNCKFVVVQPDDSSEAINNVAEKLSESLKKMICTDVSVVSEKYAPKDRIHLYLGKTKAAKTSEIGKYTPIFGYLVTAKDQDLFFFSHDDALLLNCVIAFTLQSKQYFNNGVFQLPGDYSLLKESVSPYLIEGVPCLNAGENVTVLDCDDGYYMAFIESVGKNSFLQFTEKISENGFSLYMQNDMNNNLFYTFAKENGAMVHTYWIEHSQEVRVIVTNNANLPKIQSVATSNPICTSLIRQFDVSHGVNANNGGMGYLIRLEDGSFILIDGGYETEECADEIYNSLKELAPDPNHIVVSMWYMTHGHDDHYGAFVKFTDKYYTEKSITVKSFLYNMCTTPSQCKYIDTSGCKKIKSYTNLYYPNATVYKALTGQKYRISNVSVEVFYTMQDFMPNLILNEPDAKTENDLKGDGNVQSIVSKFTIGNESFFVMADTTTVCCNEISKRYQSYLKSDYVQMAHHGLSYDSPRARNATKEIYGYILPKYAFLPCSDERYYIRIRYDVNAYLKSLVYKIYVSGKGTTTVILD